MGAAGFAIAQPVLASFGDSPETFVAAGASRGAIVMFALAVILVPALGLWAVAAATGAAGPDIRRWAQSVVIGLLVATTVLWAADDLLSGAPLVVAAIGFGAAAVFAYRRLEAVRLFVAFAVTGPVAFLAMFLATSLVSNLIFVPEAKSTEASERAGQPSVVMVMLDELPTMSLLDDTDQIDRELFPNLAAFADDSTLYRNHTAVATYTDASLPAMLTGKFSKTETATREDYKNNMFTLFGGSHEINAHEAITSLCPPASCERTIEKAALGSLGRQAWDLWFGMVDPRTPATPAQPTSATASPVDTPLAQMTARDALMEGRLGEIDTFVDSLQREAGRPRFDFVHMLLPHSPWELVAGGARYTDDKVPLGSALLGVWVTESAAQLGRQRHLLQLQYTDERVGGVLDRLKDLDRYENSYIVVVADHGVSFQKGAPSRDVTPENVQEILWTPLLIKAPGQTGGEVDDANVESIDVLPTMADLMDVEIPWEVDGRSLLRRESRPADDKRFLPGAFQDVSRFPLRDGLLRVDGEAGFETMLDSPPAVPAPSDDPLAVYRLAPYTDLTGTPVKNLASGPPVDWAVRLKDPDRYEDVRPDGSELPVYVSGAVKEPADPQKTLAVSVNGVIGGWGRFESSAVREETGFGVMIPPSLFRSGSNKIELFAVEGEPGSVTLRPVELDG